MSSSTGSKDQLDSGGRVALLIIVEIALLSQIAAGVLLLYVVFNAIRSRLRPPTVRGSQPSHLTRTATNYYFANLLFIDLLQGLCSALHIKWIGQGHVDSGSYCRIQGFFKQFGDLGVASTILVIAAHTFALLTWEISNTKWLPLSVIGAIWLFLILCTAIPAATSENYYYPTTYWCSANPGYDDQYYGLDQYIPGITIISWVVLYVLPLWRHHRSDRNYSEHLRQQLFVYPTACVVVFTRITVARMLQFNSLLSHLLVPSISLVSLAGIGFARIAFARGLLYVIIRPFIICAKLFTFFSNGGGTSTVVAGKGNSGAAAGQRRGGDATPKATVTDGSKVNSGSYPDLADLESGVQGDGNNQGIELQLIKPMAV